MVFEYGEAVAGPRNGLKVKWVTGDLLYEQYFLDPPFA